MRQVTRKGLMTVAAATGVLAVTGGYAHADSGAHGSATGSPGVLSGNSVQVPVHVPVNVCGNTVNVIGLLNPAAGNTCVNQGGSHAGGGGGGSHAGGHTGGSPGVGSGNTVQVPVDAPVNVCGNSVNVIGIGNEAAGNNCANVPGGGHSTTPPGGGHGTPPPGGGQGTPPGGGHGTPPGGGHCTPPGGNHGTPPGTPHQPGHPAHPGTPQQPGGTGTAGHTGHFGAQSVTQRMGAGQLAHTGSDLPLGVLVPAGAGALLGGALLYRKARAGV
ncbi:Tat pathway signal protein [Streptomyces hygroscopicus]|uniref:chaplin n=1 Tax=Streptomyces hygroscopicus TaxID=1912 RepID=UPI002AD431B0|nr:chaplin [Streptomyces hygroscopicus]MCW7943063.1 Tat pathway signal protein [Streptomyces hygroscopicus]